MSACFNQFTTTKHHTLTSIFYLGAFIAPFSIFLLNVIAGWFCCFSLFQRHWPLKRFCEFEFEGEIVTGCDVGMTSAATSHFQLILASLDQATTRNHYDLSSCFVALLLHHLSSPSR